jgi:hypothetical protein
MKIYTDKQLADYLLEMRQRDGRASSWSRFKKNRWRIVLFFGLSLVLCGLAAFGQAWWLCGFIFGLVFGILSRDRSHVQQLQRIWPFYDKVIDWLKVEKISHEEPSA